MDKYTNYISWDEYFMGIALLSAQRSKDPNTRVGTCIVNTENKIIGIGYNGFPIGIPDEDLPWGNSSTDLNDTKYPYVVHAELNAVLNAVLSTKNAKLYTGLFPCNECTKVIIQSGINEIIYFSDKYADTQSNIAAKKMLNLAGVKYKKFIAVKESLVLEMNCKE